MKITVPGPFTMAPAGAERLLSRRRPKPALDYAEAVNAEINDLFAAGADVVQIDEPYMQARPEAGARTTASTRSIARWKA